MKLQKSKVMKVPQVITNNVNAKSIAMEDSCDWTLACTILTIAIDL